MSNNQTLKTSGILQQAITIKKVNKGEATHFALCNGDKIRYLIDLNGGKQLLSKNIATYSSKLGLLMKLMNVLPLSTLKMMRLGYFFRVQLHPAVNKYIQQIDADGWNMIVGTYDEKQKLVLQCYRKNDPLATFIKIGNDATQDEMKAEICFMKEKKTYKSFQIPEIIDFEFAGVDAPFNIQLTKEFVGEKVIPGITEEIIEIYKELCSETQLIDVVEYEFSHGDFAPWNIKKNENGHVVFDWEHCGMRVKGFDLMHYAVVPKMMLEGKALADAYREGLEEIRKLIPDFQINQRQFETEYRLLRLE